MSIVISCASFVLAPVKWIVSPFHEAVKRRVSSDGKLFKPRREFSIPVGGLDQSKILSLYYAIDQATQDDVDYDTSLSVSDVWLQCVVASQYFSDRLLLEIRAVEYHMDFWKARMKAGGNNMFLAVSRGPLAFLRALRRGLHKLTGRAERERFKASHRIEHRIVTLRTMRAALAMALAHVHDATLQLHIRPRFADGDSVDSQTGPLEEVEGSTAIQVAAAVDACASELLLAMTNLQALQKQLDAQQEGRLDIQVSSRPVLCIRESSSRRFDRSLSIQASLPSVEEVPDRLHAAAATLRNWRSAVRASDLRLSFEGRPIAALKHATSEAHATRRDLLHAPGFARAPSQLQRHWLRYTLNGVVIGWALSFVARHSPLCGSSDLQDWAHNAYMSMLRGFRDNVVKPLTHVRDEFFETFQSRSSIVSRAGFEQSKTSLRRMLQDFERDVARQPASDSDRSDAEIDAQGMATLMRHYEKELKQPIWNAISGTLPRSLLIQVQKLKVDTEAAMLEMDQILRANELTMAVTAALPAIVVAAGLVWMFFKLLLPPPPNWKRIAAPARTAMAYLERAIESATIDEEGDGALLTVRSSEEQRGIILYAIARVRTHAGRVYASSNRHLTALVSESSSLAEWRNVEADLLEMAAATSVKVQARIAKRMHRSYVIFQA